MLTVLVVLAVILVALAAVGLLIGSIHTYGIWGELLGVNSAIINAAGEVIVALLKLLE